MIRTARLPLLAAALVVAALAALPSAGAGEPAPRVAEGFFVRQHYHDFQGIFATVQQPGRPRLRAAASLHGLDPGVEYELAGVDQPCSVDLDEAGIEQARVFELPVVVSENGDAFVTRPIARDQGVRATRSLRVYEKEQEADIVQRDCVPALIGAIAGGGKGAAIGAAAKPGPRLVEGFLVSGEFRGIIGGGLGTGGRVRAFASLHGLDPAGSYRVVGSNKPCGIQLVAGVEPLIAFDVTPGRGGDAFVTRPIALHGRFRSMRSLRVYEKEREGVVQHACKAAVFIGGGAATGALIGR